MKNNVGNDNDSTMEALLSDAKLSYLCPNVLKHKQPTGGRNVPDKARLLSGQEITRIINYKNHNNKFPQIDPINASYIAYNKKQNKQYCDDVNGISYRGGINFDGLTRQNLNNIFIDAFEITSSPSATSRENELRYEAKKKQNFHRKLEKSLNDLEESIDKIDNIQDIKNIIDEHNSNTIKDKLLKTINDNISQPVNFVKYALHCQIRLLKSQLEILPLLLHSKNIIGNMVSGKSDEVMKDELAKRIKNEKMFPQKDIDKYLSNQNKQAQSIYDSYQQYYWQLFATHKKALNGGVSTMNIALQNPSNTEFKSKCPGIKTDKIFSQNQYEALREIDDFFSKRNNSVNISSVQRVNRPTTSVRNLRDKSLISRLNTTSFYDDAQRYSTNKNRFTAKDFFKNPASKLSDKGGMIRLTGETGSGKTFLIDEMIRMYKEAGYLTGEVEYVNLANLQTLADIADDPFLHGSLIVIDEGYFYAKLFNEGNQQNAIAQEQKIQEYIRTIREKGGTILWSGASESPLTIKVRIQRSEDNKFNIIQDIRAIEEKIKNSKGSAENLTNLSDKIISCYGAIKYVDNRTLLTLGKTTGVDKALTSQKEQLIDTLKLSSKIPQTQELSDTLIRQLTPQNFNNNGRLQKNASNAIEKLVNQLQTALIYASKHNDDPKELNKEIERLNQEYSLVDRKLALKKKQLAELQNRRDEQIAEQVSNGEFVKNTGYPSNFAQLINSIEQQLTNSNHKRVQYIIPEFEIDNKVIQNNVALLQSLCNKSGFNKIIIPTIDSDEHKCYIYIKGKGISEQLIPESDQMLASLNLSKEDRVLSVFGRNSVGGSYSAASRDIDHQFIHSKSAIDLNLAMQGTGRNRDPREFARATQTFICADDNINTMEDFFAESKKKTSRTDIEHVLGYLETKIINKYNIDSKGFSPELWQNLYKNVIYWDISDKNKVNEIVSLFSFNTNLPDKGHMREKFIRDIRSYAFNWHNYQILNGKQGIDNITDLTEENPFPANKVITMPFIDDEQDIQNKYLDFEYDYYGNILPLQNYSNIRQDQVDDITELIDEYEGFVEITDRGYNSEQLQTLGQNLSNFKKIYDEFCNIKNQDITKILAIDDVKNDIKAQALLYVQNSNKMTDVKTLIQGWKQQIKTASDQITADINQKLTELKDNNINPFYYLGQHEIDLLKGVEVDLKKEYTFINEIKIYDLNGFYNNVDLILESKKQADIAKVKLTQDLQTKRQNISDKHKYIVEPGGIKTLIDNKKGEMVYFEKLDQNLDKFKTIYDKLQSIENIDIKEELKFEDLGEQIKLQALDYLQSGAFESKYQGFINNCDTQITQAYTGLKQQLQGKLTELKNAGINEIWGINLTKDPQIDLTKQKTLIANNDITNVKTFCLQADRKINELQNFKHDTKKLLAGRGVTINDRELNTIYQNNIESFQINIKNFEAGLQILTKAYDEYKNLSSHKQNEEITSQIMADTSLGQCDTLYQTSKYKTANNQLKIMSSDDFDQYNSNNSYFSNASSDKYSSNNSMLREEDNNLLLATQVKELIPLYIAYYAEHKQLNDELFTGLDYISNPSKTIADARDKVAKKFQTSIQENIKQLSDNGIASIKINDLELVTNSQDIKVILSEKEEKLLLSGQEIECDLIDFNDKIAVVNIAKEGLDNLLSNSIQDSGLSAQELLGDNFTVTEGKISMSGMDINDLLNKITEGSRNINENIQKQTEELARLTDLFDKQDINDIKKDVSVKDQITFLTNQYHNIIKLLLTEVPDYQQLLNQEKKSQDDFVKYLQDNNYQIARIKTEIENIKKGKAEEIKLQSNIRQRSQELYNIGIHKLEIDGQALSTNDAMEINVRGTTANITQTNPNHIVLNNINIEQFVQKGGEILAAKKSLDNSLNDNVAKTGLTAQELLKNAEVEITDNQIKFQTAISYDNYQHDFNKVLDPINENVKEQQKMLADLTEIAEIERNNPQEGNISKQIEEIKNLYKDKVDTIIKNLDKGLQQDYNNLNDETKKIKISEIETILKNNRKALIESWLQDDVNDDEITKRSKESLLNRTKLNKDNIDDFVNITCSSLAINEIQNSLDRRLSIEQTHMELLNNASKLYGDIQDIELFNLIQTQNKDALRELGYRDSNDIANLSQFIERLKTEYIANLDTENSNQYFNNPIIKNPNAVIEKAIQALSKTKQQELDTKSALSNLYQSNIKTIKEGDNIFSMADANITKQDNNDIEITNINGQTIKINRDNFIVNAKKITSAINNFKNVIKDKNSQYQDEDKIISIDNEDITFNNIDLSKPDEFIAKLKPAEKEILIATKKELLDNLSEGVKTDLLNHFQQLYPKEMPTESKISDLIEDIWPDADEVSDTVSGIYDKRQKFKQKLDNPESEFEEQQEKLKEMFYEKLLSKLADREPDPDIDPEDQSEQEILDKFSMQELNQDYDQLISTMKADKAPAQQETASKKEATTKEQERKPAGSVLNILTILGVILIGGGIAVGIMFGFTASAGVSIGLGVLFGVCGVTFGLATSESEPVNKYTPSNEISKSQTEKNINKEIADEASDIFKDSEIKIKDKDGKSKIIMPHIAKDKEQDNQKLLN